MRRPRISIRTGLLALALGSTAALAAQPSSKPLPSFDLQTTAGAATTSADLAQSGRWLLVVVRADDAASARLLGVLDAQARARGTAARVAIVVAGASPEEVPIAMAPFEHLAGARWASDAESHSIAALELSGVPVVMGVQDATLAWTVSGAAPANDRWSAILADWLR